jgi:two-component system alkaline phosphatase synthesis response regulator PhoP
VRVLIVEDEFLIAKAVRNALQRDGHDVTIAGTGGAGIDLVTSWRPDVVLLDLMLPDQDGRDVARTIRAISDVPLVIVTARGEEADRIAGLEIGADDYVVKPVSMGELLARIRAVTRRARTSEAPSSERLVHKDLVIDLDEHRAYRGKEALSLSRKEFEILRMLMARPGRLVRRAQLAHAVWGLGPGEVGKTLDVHLSYLRRKLDDNPREPVYIETVRGVGFRMA